MNQHKNSSRAILSGCLAAVKMAFHIVAANGPRMHSTFCAWKTTGSSLLLKASLHIYSLMVRLYLAIASFSNIPSCTGATFGTGAAPPGQKENGQRWAAPATSSESQDQQRHDVATPAEADQAKPGQHQFTQPGTERAGAGAKEVHHGL